MLSLSQWAVGAAALLAAAAPQAYAWGCTCYHCNGTGQGGKLPVTDESSYQCGHSSDSCNYNTGDYYGGCYAETGDATWVTNCYCQSTIPETQCQETQDCFCNGEVVFGFADKWSEKKLISGNIKCSTDEFGDPYPGQAKICKCLWTSANGGRGIDQMSTTKRCGTSWADANENSCLFCEMDSRGVRLHCPSGQWCFGMDGDPDYPALAQKWCPVPPHSFSEDASTPKPSGTTNVTELLAADACKTKYSAQDACDKDAVCTWCKSAAVPSSCFTKVNAKKLPDAVFECDSKAEEAAQVVV